MPQTLLDLNTDEMTEQFSAAPVYRKSAVVTARPVVPGEVVETILANGRHETTQVVEDGFVVTNPGGERYVISDQKLRDRYDHLGGDRYRAKGMCRAFPNPLGVDITVMAPWGKQDGEADAMVAVVYDPDKPDEVGDDRYLIGGQEFKDTYQLVVS